MEYVQEIPECRDTTFADAKEKLEFEGK